MHFLLRRWAMISLLLATVLGCSAAIAEIKFPTLSGRVVDNANMLSTAARQQLNAQLEAHENATSNQVVVVTLESLQGYTIEDFGYQLGRHWGIGQKDKNNGALLIIAPNERKIRIEVGYGLEGELTDAISANIIQAVISPAFKRGKFDDGVLAGAYAIIDALGGKYEMRARKTTNDSAGGWLLFIFLLVMVPTMIFDRLAGTSRLGRRRGYHGGGWGGGGFGGGGFGGGGFGGGGGGFGGGGASGGW